MGYRLCRRPLGPEEWMLGCLDARMPSFVAFLCTREHQSADAGMPGCSDACQMSHLAFPCGREHQFEGQEGGGLEVCRPEIPCGTDL